MTVLEYKALKKRWKHWLIDLYDFWGTTCSDEEAEIMWKDFQKQLAKDFKKAKTNG